MKKINIFFSSVEADEIFRQEIKKRLIVLGRQVDLEVLYESEISAGDDWRKKVKTYFDEAEVVVLLISPDYIASDFHYTEILEKVIQKVESGAQRAVPIHVRPVSWEELSIGELLPVPKEQPISAYEDRDAAFLHVKEEIKKVIKRQVIHLEALKTAGQPQLIKTKLEEVVCPMCGQNEVDLEERIFLESIEKLETGYALEGKAMIHCHSLNRCGNCGNVFNEVEDLLPVEIPDSLICPICDKKVAMNCSVKKTKRVSEEYVTFQAIWDCKFCNYFKPLAKGLKFIRELARIIVGAETIKVEKK